ncbi:MAG: NB-ARC domain-containing protein [Calothrix sp. MO_192.B10]|nr:NB-ARC domain-containing protein [Calothrix sp. MO_192.B10]
MSPQDFSKSEEFLRTIGVAYQISNSELQVLAIAIEGELPTAIANRLKIKGDALRQRLSQIYRKFGIQGKGPVKFGQLQQLMNQLYQEWLQNGNIHLIQDEFENYQKVEHHGGDNYNLCLTKIKTKSTLNHEGNTHKTTIDWGNAPDVSSFYGRTTELEILEDWIVNQDCRIVTLLGIGGIGKTALGVRLARRIQEQFDYLVWRSLYHLPTFSDFLNILIQALCKSQESPKLETVNQQVHWLINRLRQQRCLIILDGLEFIFQKKKLAGVYREGYEYYGNFIKRIAEEPLKSCLLLTSRENFSEVSLLEGENSPVRVLKLGGLSEAANQLLQGKKLSGQAGWEQLIQVYSGNPLMLKLVATTIQEVFDGNVTDFLSTTLFTHDVIDFVAEMLERLSELETTIILEMVKTKEPIKLAALQNHLSEVSQKDLIRALLSLRQRSLVDKSQGGFTLPPAVRETVVQLYNFAS